MPRSCWKSCCPLSTQERRRRGPTRWTIRIEKMKRWGAGPYPCPSLFVCHPNSVHFRAVILVSIFTENMLVSIYTYSGHCRYYGKRTNVYRYPTNVKICIFQKWVDLLKCQPDWTRLFLDLLKHLTSALKNCICKFFPSNVDFF